MESLSTVLVLCGLCLTLATAEYKHDHMTVTCQGSRSTSVGGRLESSTALTYKNNMNCTFTVTAPSNKMISVVFNYFETETKLGGVCLDYLNIHDGATIAASTLNTAPLCELQNALPDYTTSGRYVTFNFVTDENTVGRGFDLIYTVYSNAPCGSSDFACNDSTCIDSSLQYDYYTCYYSSSYTAPCGSSDFACNDSTCIDSSLKCDGYQQCLDGSDESLCTVAGTTSSALSMGLIVGCSAAGLVGLFFLIFTIYKLVSYYKWQQWLKQHDLHKNPWDEEPFQYPVTQHYHAKLPHSVRTRGVHPALPGQEGGGRVSQGGAGGGGEVEEGREAWQGERATGDKVVDTDAKSTASVDSTYKPPLDEYKLEPQASTSVA